MLERLQKILSARGIASRRKAEEYILQGLVLVNGKPAILGQKADPAVDRIEVKGEVMEARKEMLYYVMHKPRGIVTSNIEKSPGKKHAGGNAAGSPTVRELLPLNLQGKVFPVGRLDKDSTGLLLLTNDGVLAYRLTHPKFDHEKEYEVETEEEITNGQLQKMREGLMILGEKTKPATVERTGKRNFRIALTEGKNRQIRRMCEKVGCTVKNLQRIRIMTLRDPLLKEGKIRLLTSQEKAQLLASVGL
ncbi:MAG: pseudouridine synthase [Candidatus Peribacteraceae bacterium]|jgi:23S rRNA pseudouridine2605 synthase/23S rRNA pseudouridine2604 synthase